MTVCKRVLYRGNVQGVGFRHSTWTVAKHYDVTGYVKNLPSGDVELVAQGEAAEVERFLKGVANRLASYIQEQQVDDETVSDFGSFEIRH